MARVQLENQLTIPLYRVVFTGTAYTVEPPEMIPPNALVFWQADDSGSVTYSASASPPRGTTGAPTVQGNFAPTYPPASTIPAGLPADGATSTAIATPTYPPATEAAPRYDQATVVGNGYATDPRIAATPTNPGAAVRPFTLTWQFSATGHPHFTTQDVAPGLSLSMRELFDGAIYTVHPASRKRAPIAPRRRAPIIALSSVISALLLVSVVAAVAYNTGHLPFLRGHIPFGLFGSSTTAPAVTLTASQPGVAVGTSVTLTASTTGDIPSGYHVDIVDGSGQVVAPPSPCAGGQSCTAVVSSPTPANITYTAYIEQGVGTGVLAKSTSVTVTWLPPNAPTTITLTSDPAADASGRVKVEIGTIVKLMATTDIDVGAAHYQISIEDANGSRATSPCKKGTTCNATVSKSSAATAIYIAYAEPTDAASVKLPSSPITIEWVPPQPPTSVSLSSNPAADGSNSVKVNDGTTVTLTATAGSSLTGTGYEIDIFDTNGNQVGGPCTSGRNCSAQVKSDVAAANVYIAHVEQGHLSGIKTTSNTIAVTWIQPQPPTNVTLDASNTSPAWGENVTLTANASSSVTGTGYIIQIVDLTDASNEIKRCDMGSSCQITLSNPNTGTTPIVIQYAAYIDQGSPGVSIASSPTDTVGWPEHPSPTVSLSSNPADNNGLVSVPNDTIVTLTAAASSDVGGTGYEIEIVASGGIPGVTCTYGLTCPWTGGYNNPSGNTTVYFTAYIVRISDNNTVYTSRTIEVEWYVPSPG